MGNLIRKIAVVWIIAALVVIPVVPAFAQPEFEKDKVSSERMVVDFLVARPLGFVALAAGAAIFVVSLPFSAAGGNSDVASEKLVKEPADFVFKRPLGEF